MRTTADRSIGLSVVLNKHFKANEVEFGIGIDFGSMLAAKTAIRRHGYEQTNYRNLVWLGRIANVASKLTDMANKSVESVTILAVNVAYDARASGGGLINTAPDDLNALASLFSPPSRTEWNALTGVFRQILTIRRMVV